MKSFLSALLLCCFALAASAQTVLYSTGDSTGYPYRIPAIAKAVNGDLIAFSDWRPCGRDIGFGKVDILARISPDNGKTWGEPFKVLEGTGEGITAGYGDACVVADRHRNELLLVCVAGDVVYFQSTPQKRPRIVSLHARYNRKSRTWEWEKQVTDHSHRIYDDLLHGTVHGLFMGSGRICQSRKVKVGDYYRLYAALCTRKGNFVVYSDDFGRSWDLLGNYQMSCAPQGDEPKCEELPDGSVLLSSRKEGGRYFNVFRYFDVRYARGMWGQPVDSRMVEGGIANESTPCNGEILMVKARRVADGKSTTLALQSLPAGPRRSHVTIYYKELDTPETYATPIAFAAGWTGSYQVSDRLSGYSTMIQQEDRRIAFYYEEEPHEYQMVYKSLSLEEITHGAYEARKPVFPFSAD